VKAYKPYRKESEIAKKETMPLNQVIQAVLDNRARGVVQQSEQNTIISTKEEFV